MFVAKNASRPYTACTDSYQINTKVYRPVCAALCRHSHDKSMMLGRVNVPMSAVAQSHRRAAQGAGRSPCRGMGKGRNAAMHVEDECKPTVGC